MIIDNTLVFSNQQAVTVSTASTNTLDLGTTGTPFGASAPLIRNVGLGQPLELSVSVAQTFLGLTSLQVSIQTSPDGVTWTTRETGRAVPVAELAQGYLFRVPAVIEDAGDRYVQLYYTVVGAATQGSLNAAVVASRQTNVKGNLL